MRVSPDQALQAFVDHRAREWGEDLEFESLFRALARLLDEGLASRNEPALDVARLKLTIAEVLDELCLAAHTADRECLKDFRSAAQRAFRRSDRKFEFGSIYFNHGTTTSQDMVRSYVFYLREEAELMLRDRESADEIAKACEQSISGMCKGLPSDDWPRERKRAAIRMAVARGIRLDDPEAIVRAALKACGYDNPNMFKAIDQKETRKKQATRNKR